MSPYKWLLCWSVAAMLIPSAVAVQVNVLTYHNDNGRTGQNLNETILTPANVNSSTFGKIFTYNVDGYVYAQPLYVSAMNIPGQGIHNVVFIATENNTVYALDADSNTGANAGVLWRTNLGPAASSASMGFTPIVPEVGITGTPVIDPTTGILYVDAFTQSGANFTHTLHALNITNGTEMAFSPVTVSASVPGVGIGSVSGVQHFQPGQELQRPALTLANGILYVAYAGFTDTPTQDPFHGWVIGFNASNLQQLPSYVFNDTPNGTTSEYGSFAGRGGIWMGGGGLAVDANNNLYFSTGDGDFNAFNNSGGTEYGDTILKLSTSGSLAVADYFTTENQGLDNTNDLDVGSGAVMLLPDQPGSIPHLMIGAGKPGTAYLMNRDQMTAGNDHYDPTKDAVLAKVQLAGDCYNTPAYFNGTIYYAAQDDHLVGYVVSNSSIPQIPNQLCTNRIFGFPGATPGVSANGTSNGIVWGMQRLTQTNTPLNALWACNATNLTTEIYDSTQAGARDQLTNVVKFIVPTVANGKVYIGGQSNLTVFGLLGGALQFSSPTYTVPENAGTATITVNRAGGSQGAVQVKYATTSGGTAVQGQEYLSTSGTLSWASGDSSSKTFNVTILDNGQAETNHTIFLVLSNATGGAALGATANAVLTIQEGPYDIWKFTHFGANANNPAIAGNTADPTGDGIINILKYAFALNPNVADTTPPVAGSIISNHFQLQFDRNTFATDLSYTVEATGSITDSWSSLLTYSWPAGWVTNLPGSTVVETAPTGSPPDRPAGVTITDPVNTTSPSATNRFFRLQIQQ